MVERVHNLVIRVGPFLVSALTLVLAACQQGGGASGGPGY